MGLGEILSSVKNSLKSIAAVFIFLLLWELLPRVGIINAAFLPPLSEVLITFWTLVLSGELMEHISISLQRAITGFGLALLIAIPLGIAMGWYKRFEKFVDPLLQTFRQTSALALFPVFILFFGIGEISKFAIVFWATLWPVLLSTISGVKYVDPLLIKSARAMALNDIALFKKVILPAAVPSIMTGIRLGATSSILVLVAAEMIGAKSGVGFMVINSQYNFEISKMYVAIVVLALLGLAYNYLLVWLERKATSWKEEVVGA
jgi:NitT/TauT family transport system permease protein